LQPIFKKSRPMTNYLITIFLLGLSLASNAQQLPLFTQYRDNIGIINPAAPNSNFLIQQQNVSIGASYRKQWVGLENAPTTQVLRYEHFMAYTGNSFSPLFGTYILRDVTGPLGMTGLYGKFGGAITSDPEVGGFSAALSAGLVAYHLDTDKLRTRDAGDVVASGRSTRLFPDVGLGVYYWQRLGGRGFFEDDLLSGGVSIPQVIGLNLRFKSEDKQYTTQRIQHFYGNFSWLHSIDDDDKFIQPSVWIKYAPNAPLNIDLNLRYQIAPIFWIGAGSSTGGNFHAETGFNIGENAGIEGLLRIGYGFDYSFSRIGPFAGSTHEFNIVYAFSTK
jgi:type IX secretion system PorP/SprF family membrane protein